MLNNISFLALFVFCSLIRTFAPAKAQMAESVDALVSNTSGATHPGSSPGLGTKGGASSDTRPAFLLAIAFSLFLHHVKCLTCERNYYIIQNNHNLKPFNC